MAKCSTLRAVLAVEALENRCLLSGTPVPHQPDFPMGPLIVQGSSPVSQSPGGSTDVQSPGSLSLSGGQTDHGMAGLRSLIGRSRKAHAAFTNSRIHQDKETPADRVKKLAEAAATAAGTAAFLQGEAKKDPKLQSLADKAAEAAKKVFDALEKAVEELGKQGQNK
jgi:hypothetical protein